MRFTARRASARLGGCRRISDQIYDETRNPLVRVLQPVSRDAITFQSCRSLEPLDPP